MATGGASGILAALVFLGAAVVAVPAFRYAGLSAVLGYLLAGLAIGPSGLGLFTEPALLRSVAELGVVLFLFVVGLELKPSKLLSMRADILGLGGAQLAVTMLVLGVPLFALGMSLGGTLAVAFALALSATAIALQILDERGAMATAYGRKSFAILLFQDLAIVPVVVLLPLLAGGMAGAKGGWADHAGTVAMAAGAVLALVLAGRFLLNPLFRLLARAGAREVMTAAALLVVLGAAEAMHHVGLSAALGAFLAGLLLSESDFRHQLEADIEPFRGLLLGLFFMSVGMSVEGSVIAREAGTIAGAAVAVFVAKFALVYGLLRAARLGASDALRAAALLAPVSEFAFVVLPLASANRLVPSETVAVLTAIAAATMFLGPLAAKGLEGWLASRPLPPVDSSGVATASGEAGEALVIGFGRFGQVVNQMLLAAERQVTVIDRNIDQIRTAERFGFKVFYGDGKRLDVLRAAGAEKAAVIAICVDDREAASTIAEMARRAFPQARLVVRAYDRTHALDLMQRGVRQPFRETFESALAFGREALQNLGLDENSAEAIRLDIRRRDIARLDRQRNEGMFAGMDLLHGTKLVPEPLREPGRKGAALAVPARPAPDAASEGATGQSS